MKVVFNGGIAIAFVVYEIISIPPYLHFGTSVKENILETYEEDYGDTPFLKIANCSMALTLFCSIPIILWPLRSCVISLYSFLRDENVYADPNRFLWIVATICCL